VTVFAINLNNLHRL